MSQLADTIAFVSARETERAEAALAATLHGLRDEFAAWASAHSASVDTNPPSLKPFDQFCLANCVPPLPCRPSTLAAFILAEIARGTKAEPIRSMVAAIDTLHDRNGFASPASTSLVRFALNRMKPVSPPRSWTAEEQALFIALPAEIQSVIGRREASRETALRNKQNQLAEELKKAKPQQPDSADKPVITEKVIEHHGEA
jgi:hypothetical protein